MSQTVAAEPRRYGVDILRMLSMFMVVTLHILGKGGVLGATEPLSLSYELAWLIEIMALCAVNCYAIISGYVCYGSKFRYSSVVMLWLQVAFYTITVTAAFMIFQPEILTEEHIKKALFPVSTNQYWYFTAYFALFFFIPLLNTAISAMSRSQLAGLTVAIFILFSVIPTVFNADPFVTTSGYSFVWLMLLYIVGAFLRKYDIPSHVKTGGAVAVYFICALLTWAGKYLFDTQNELIGDMQFIRYTSPTMVFAALALVIAFARLKTGPRLSKVISVLSPLAFSVYLIHSQKLIWNQLFIGRFAKYAEFSAPLLILAVIGSAMVIYSLCCLIDVVRHLLFTKTGLKKALIRLEEKFAAKRSEETPSP